MFDQSFSVKNFRKIYNLDRKNKGSIENDYFPDAYKIRQKIYAIKKLISLIVIRHQNSPVSETNFESRKVLLNHHIELRKEQYDIEITDRLNEIVTTINKKGYVLPLNKSPFKISNKDVFSVGKDIETVFVSKHLQNILSSIYNVKLNDRDIIVSRLCSIVSDLSPKYIIRADVDSFYESISHEKLLAILHSSPNLSVTPRRILTQLIRSYALMSANNKGLPRGVGISAYLSEVYMGDIDKQVKRLKDVVYYERYVDDLIIVFSPTSKINLTYYINDLDKIIKSKGLMLNNKTKLVDLFTSANGNFEYLGYSFTINASSANVSLSNNKKQRYRERVDDTFSEYFKEEKCTRKKAYKVIVLRIRFLTGNTRLYNSKANAFVGVYFSNKYITNTSDLNGLDNYLKSKINSIPDAKLKRRLMKSSFVDGYQNKIFRKFSIKELSNISKAWKKNG